MRDRFNVRKGLTLEIILDAAVMRTVKRAEARAPGAGLRMIRIMRSLLCRLFLMILGGIMLQQNLQLVRY